MEQGENGEMCKINQQESDKHSTCHSESNTPLAKLAMTTDTKGGLAQKGYNLTDC